jgi:hypothetical protein
MTLTGELNHNTWVSAIPKTSTPENTPPPPASTALATQTHTHTTASRRGDTCRWQESYCVLPKGTELHTPTTTTCCSACKLSSTAWPRCKQGQCVQPRQLLNPTVPGSRMEPAARLPNRSPLRQWSAVVNAEDAAAAQQLHPKCGTASVWRLRYIYKSWPCANAIMRIRHHNSADMHNT